MAIAAMKKVTLVAMKQDRHKLLGRMQRLGCVQVTQQGEDAQQPDNEDARALDDGEAWLGRLDSAIKNLSRYEEKKKGAVPRPVLDDAAIAKAQAGQDKLAQAIVRLDELEREIAQLRARQARLESQIALWRPWQALRTPLEQVRDSAHVRMWLGTAERRKAEILTRELAQSGAVAQVIGTGREGTHLFIAAHRAHEQALQPILKDAGFVRAQFGDLKGTFERNIHQARGQIAQLQAQQQQLEQERAAMAGLLPDLRAAYDLTALRRERLHTAGQIARTRSTVILQGWVPAHKAQALQEAVRGVSADAVLSLADPGEGDKPPVLLKNGWFGSQFEGVVQMFSLPDPFGLDPSTVMGPFFLLFFGMMVSDAGYGVVLSILALLFVLKAKPKGMTGQIAAIMVMGGVSTLFWGIMFGGWFGISVTPVLVSPMTDPLNMLILCFGLGLLHVFAGLGVGMYMNFKRRQYWSALFDQGFWMFLVGGLVMLVIPQTAAVGKILAPVGGIGIILTAKRDSGASLPKRILGGLGKLYDLSGYLSDVLSYARLFGMGLATGIIALVFNTVAQMLMTSPIGFIFGLLVLLVGHAFNIGINVLGAFVHSCRLQYIEFFGKFYESGGVQFRPMRIKTKYIQLQDNGK